jgi:hypothetical protein
MDLRGKNLTPEQIQRAEEFVRYHLLWYQPFIFADDFETGEGMNFHDRYTDNVCSIYRPGIEAPNDPTHFRECNQLLRELYEQLTDSLVHQLGNISKLSFAEFGCNSGYFMYALSLRGAKQTIGFDFAPNQDLFEFLNSILGTNSEFRWAEWDSLHHTVRHAEFEKVDVTMSLAVTPHILDPVQHLCYLCDRARKAVFFWIPINEKDDLSVTFSDPHYHQDPNLDFPVNINSGVQLSRPLLRKILIESGFEDIREVKPTSISPQWDRFVVQHAAHVAFRTRDFVTAISGGRYARPALPRYKLTPRERFGRWRRRVLS